MHVLDFDLFKFKLYRLMGDLGLFWFDKTKVQSQLLEE